jgi:imidazolonepropionase-like amidohydrolase
MKNVIEKCMLLLVAILAFGCAERAAGRHGDAAADALPSIVLRDVRVFDVHTGGMSEPRDVLIEEDRITQVGPGIDAAPGRREIDCAGKYAVPGLFDCHTHLCHLTEEGDEGLRAGLEAFIKSGVTQVRDVGGPIDILSDMAGRVAAGEITGPEIFYTGPMLESSPLTWEKVNEKFPGFTVAIDSPEDADRVIPALARQGAPIIKTFNKIDKDLYAHIVEVARQHGLKIVHDPGTPLFHWMPMDEALDLGITSIEHAKAPWPVVLNDELKQAHDRLVGPEAAEMAQQMFMMQVFESGLDSISREKLVRLADQMKEKGAYLCPTLKVLTDMEESVVEQIKEEQNLEEIPEPMMAMIRKGLAAMETVSRYFVSELSSQGVKLLVGQDGHEAADTIDEMRYLSACDVPAAEIIRGATIYPARWLGVEDRLGAVAPGRQANILVVDGNPLEDIDHLGSAFIVVQKGRMVFSRDGGS